MIFDKTLFALGVDGGSKEPPIYLDRNGITIKAAEWAEEGEFYTLSLGEGLPEETYYVWPNVNFTWRESLQYAMNWTYDKDTDTVLLYQMDGRRIKVGNIVTSKITNFNSMFDISSMMPPPSSGVSRWDVSNVEYIIKVLDSTGPDDVLPRIEYWNLSSCKSLRNSFRTLQPHQIPDLSRWRLADGAQIDLPSGWPENYKPRNSGPKHGTFQVELKDGSRVFLESEGNTDNKASLTVRHGAGNKRTVSLESYNSPIVRVIDWSYADEDFEKEISSGSVILLEINSVDLEEVPNYLPSYVNSLEAVFERKTKLNCDLDMWLTNKVTSFSKAFKFCNRFAGKGVENWNMFSAENLSSMMEDCFDWNPEKINWVPHRVKYLGNTFRRCSLFNPDISDLHFPVCEALDSTFRRCRNFNQPIEHLVTQNLKTTSYMLMDAASFDQPLSKLPTRNVTNMTSMLHGATSFNQDLSGMCVPKITDMPSNFDTGATSWTLPRPVWGTCPSG